MVSGYFICYPVKSKGYIFYCPNHSLKIMETVNAKFLKNGGVKRSKEQQNLDIKKIKVNTSLPIINEIKINIHLPSNIPLSIVVLNISLVVAKNPSNNG